MCRITGTIPNQLLALPSLKRLDLSNNRIGGSIQHLTDVNPGVSLSLEINRLSGFIPVEIQELSQVDILRGNLFDCNVVGSAGWFITYIFRTDKRTTHDKPTHDKEYKNYVCANDLLVSPLTIAIMLVLVGLIVFLRPPNSVARFLNNVKFWLKLEALLRRPELKRVDYLKQQFTSSSDKIEALGDPWYKYLENFNEDCPCPSSRYDKNKVNVGRSDSDKSQDLEQREVANYINEKVVAGKITRLQEFLRVYNASCKLAALFGLCIGCICPIVYLFMKKLGGDNSSGRTYDSFSTHRYQRVWWPSVAYMSGQVPAIVVAIMLVAIIIGISCAWVHLHRKYRGEDRKCFELGNIFKCSWNRSERWLEVYFAQHWLEVYIAFLLLNALWGVVNTMYVIATYRVDIRVDQTLLFLLYVVRILFKSLMMETAIKWILSRHKHRFRTREVILIFFHFKLWRDIIIPILAMIIFDTSCFAVLSSPAEIYTDFSKDVCLSGEDPADCRASIFYESTVRYTTDFTYNYQCSNQIMSNYVPLVFFILLFDGIFECVGNVIIYQLGPYPAVTLKAMYRYYRSLLWQFIEPYKRYMCNCGCYSKVRMWCSHVSDAVGEWYASSDIKRYMCNCGCYSKVGMWCSHVSDAVGEWYASSYSYILSPQDKPHEKVRHMLFPAEMYATVMNSMLLITTFGFAYPPLAIVGFFSAYITSLSAKLQVARYIDARSRIQIGQNVYDRDDTVWTTLSDDCKDATEAPLFCLKYVVFHVLVFGLVLEFDIAGDTIGVFNALWIIFALALFTMSTFFVTLGVSFFLVTHQLKPANDVEVATPTAANPLVLDETSEIIPFFFTLKFSFFPCMHQMNPANDVEMATPTAANPLVLDEPSEQIRAGGSICSELDDAGGGSLK
jgi:hypothetical protein